MFEIDFKTNTIKKVEFSGNNENNLNLRPDLETAKSDLLADLNHRIETLEWQIRRVKALTLDDVSQTSFF